VTRPVRWLSALQSESDATATTSPAATTRKARTPASNNESRADDSLSSTGSAVPLTRLAKSGGSSRATSASLERTRGTTGWNSRLGHGPLNAGGTTRQLKQQLAIKAIGSIDACTDQEVAARNATHFCGVLNISLFGFGGEPPGPGLEGESEPDGEPEPSPCGCDWSPVTANSTNDVIVSPALGQCENSPARNRKTTASEDCHQNNETQNIQSTLPRARRVNDQARVELLALCRAITTVRHR
jgi:hypothetical protein